MTPQTFALDEIPATDEEEHDEDGKVACPECGNRYLERGLKRHITMAHRTGVSDAPSTSGSGVKKSTGKLAERWAQFQNGCALLVSMACTQCAAALSEDANTDGVALDNFCQTRPKLKKQVEQFLASADFMLLVGAFGGTAKKMVAHHSIGKKLSFGIDMPQHVDADGKNPMERMASFMGSMDPEARHVLLDQAFDQMKKQAAEQVQGPIRVEPRPETAGAEPQKVGADQLTDTDKKLINVVHGGNSPFATTAPDLVGGPVG